MKHTQAYTFNNREPSNKDFSTQTVTTDQRHVSLETCDISLSNTASSWKEVPPTGMSGLMEVSKEQLELIIPVLKAQKWHLQEVAEDKSEVFSIESMLQKQQKGECSTPAQTHLVVSLCCTTTAPTPLQLLLQVLASVVSVQCK